MQAIQNKSISNENAIRKICCIGAGYVGGPTMAVIADKCPQLIINVVDFNQERIDAWNDQDVSKIPIFEPGLSTIISRVRGKNLFFKCGIPKKRKERSSSLTGHSFEIFFRARA